MEGELEKKVDILLQTMSRLDERVSLLLVQRKEDSEETAAGLVRLEEQIRRQNGRVSSLERWQAKVTGLFVALMVVVNLLVDWVRYKITGGG